MNEVNPPEDISIALKKIEAQERGVLGRFFGTKDHAPTNIAAVALILLSVLLAFAMIGPLGNGTDRASLITSLLSAITLTIGIIFGRSSGGT